MTIILIPARLAATRLPNKPLADIGGKPMIVRVWERAITADIGPVVVACAEQSIADAITHEGGIAVLTDPNLPTGTDRIAAALDMVDPDKKHQFVINVQGDLPTIEPADIKLLSDMLLESPYDMTTLVSLIHTAEEVANPNVVKAVLSCEKNARSARALYFSRQPIHCANGLMYHHIGVYGFRREALEKFVAYTGTPLEKHERLEQLRALENGMSIGAGIISHPPFGVDSPEDLERAREAYKKR